MEQVFFKNIQHTIISELQQATQSIQIAVCWFTNQAIFDVLAQKAAQNLNVSLILLDDYANRREEGLRFNDLIGLGVKLYFSDKPSPLHHKFCIIDNVTLLTGSYDWTYFSESKAIENILLIKDNQSIIDAFASEFAMLTSVLSPVSAILPYSMAEGLINDVFGLKQYLSEDVYLQALKADENGEDLKALNLMHHSAQIDEYKAEVQQEFIKEKATSGQALPIADTTPEIIAESQETVVYTSRSLGGFSPTPAPEQEEMVEVNPNEVVEIPETTYENLPEVSESQAITENIIETNNQAFDVQLNTDTENQSVQNDINIHQEMDNQTISEPMPEPVFGAESLIQQGELAYQQNRYDDAVQFFSQAIAIQATNAKAFLNIAIVKWRQGRFSEQAEYAAQSIQYDATNNKAFNTLALAQDKMGNTLEAINNYTKALELSPDNYSYLWNRAVALKMVGRRQEAILDFTKVVKLCNQVVMSQPTNQNAKQTLNAAMKEMGS
jgi:tetratricopeptide (TPR) repeat protein